MTRSKTTKAADALLGRRVQIKDDAVVKPGEFGTIARATSTGEYEVDFGGEGSAFYYRMEEFIVLPEGGGALASPGQQIEADPWLVAPSLTNPRKRKGLDVESLSALAANIKVHGLLQPIVVRPLPGERTPDTFEARVDGLPLPIYELVAGERRLRASRLAGLPTIPMILRDLDDEAALQLQLVENIEREDLDPMEEAEGFELLRTRLGFTVEQIAERIGRGKGQSYVYKTMKLLALTPESREAMYEGHLGRSTGLLVARYPAAQQADVVAFIRSQAMVGGEPAPFRTVAPLVHRRFNLLMCRAVWPIADADLLPDAGPCSTCPKRTGSQAEIFGDDAGTEDSCTDPDCFEAKRNAHIERAKAQAQKDGFTVLDEDEARRAIPSPYQGWIMGYSRVTDVAYTETGDDGTEREVTFEDALRKMGKKAPKPRILIHPHTGEAIKVITDDLADKLQPQEEDDGKGTASGAADGFDKAMGRGKYDDRPPEHQALDSSDVRRAVLLRIFDAIRSRERDAADMLLIASMFFLSLDGDLGHVPDYLGWPDLEELSYEEGQAAILEHLKALPVQDVAAATTMMAVNAAFWRNDRAGEVAIAQSYGIDVVAVLDKVAEDLAAQDKQDAEDEPEEDRDEEGIEA